MIHTQARVDRLDQKIVNVSRTIFENHLDGFKSKENCFFSNNIQKQRSACQ